MPDRETHGDETSTAGCPMAVIEARSRRHQDQFPLPGGIGSPRHTVDHERGLHEKSPSASKADGDFRSAACVA
jgi:hypothetical protein